MKWSWCSGCLCCNGAVNGSNQNSSRIQDASVETKRAKSFWNETGGPNRLWDIPNIQECQYEMTNCAKSSQNTTVLSLSKPAERSGDNDNIFAMFPKSIGSSWLPPSSTWVFPKIMGTPKTSILIGFSIINHPFGDTPVFGNTHILVLDRPDPYLLLGKWRTRQHRCPTPPGAKGHHLANQKKCTIGREKTTQSSHTLALFWSPKKNVWLNHTFKWKRTSRGCFFHHLFWVNNQEGLDRNKPYRPFKTQLGHL